MVLHPDEKAGEYACTRSSSIAVKLSANAIHTLASLSVYVCMFPLSSFMPGKKKQNKTTYLGTNVHTNHMRPGSHTEMSQDPSPRPPAPAPPSGAWRPLYPTFKRVPQWQPGIAIPLERCLWRHGGVLIRTQCLITRCRAGQGRRGWGVQRQSRHTCLRENPYRKVKIWCLSAGLLGSVPRSECRVFARQLQRITVFHAEPYSPRAARDPGVCETVKYWPPFPGCCPPPPPPPGSELYPFLASRLRVVPPGLPERKPGHARPLRHTSCPPSTDLGW